MNHLKSNQKRSEDMRDTMNPGRISTMQTRTATLCRRFSLIGLLAMTLLLCLASSALADELITNGGFGTESNWGLSGVNPPTYTETQSNGGIAGAGSVVEKITGQAGVTYTGTLLQSLTLYAGSVIAPGAIDFFAKHVTTSDTSISSVKISLRYADASTIEIFNGTIPQGSGWTNSITNSQAGIFPLTTTQDVNTLIVELSTSTNTNGNAELYFDDFTIAYTPSISNTLSIARKISVATTAEPGEQGIQMQFLQLNSNEVPGGYNTVTLTSATVLFSALDAVDAPLVTTGLYNSVTVAIDDDKIYNNGVIDEVTQAWESDDEVVVDLTAIAEVDRTVTAGAANTKYLWFLYNLKDAGTDYRVILDVSAIGVLAPDFSPIKGSSDWSSNEVYVTYGLACMGCHPTPPTDSATGVRERLTGATRGSHANHSAAQSMVCDNCHLAEPTIPNHRNNVVEMNGLVDGYAGARYDKDGDHAVTAADLAFEQSPTPALGRCENTSCHGGDNNVSAGYGGPTGVGPQWGEVAKDLCTFCHNADNANTNGEPFEGRDKSYPSSDVSASPFRTLSAASAHRVHMETELAVVVCDDCHIVPSSTVFAGHFDNRNNGRADVVPGVAASFGAPGYDTGTMVCSTTYCHGDAMPQGDTDGTTVTPDWDADLWANYPVGCTDACHGLPPMTGLSGISHAVVENMTLTQCQNCHVDSVLSALSPPNLIMNSVTHINGTIEATSDCGGCHGGANVAPSMGKHDKHVAYLSSPAGGSLDKGDPAGTVANWTAENYPLCAVCHDMSLANEPTMHKDAADHVMGAAKAASRAFSAAGNPTYNAVGTSTCRNVNCHFQETTSWK